MRLKYYKLSLLKKKKKCQILYVSEIGRKSDKTDKNFYEFS